MNLPIPRYPDSLILAKFETIGNALAKREWRVTASGETWQMFNVTVSVGNKEPWSANALAMEMSKGAGIVTRSISLAVDSLQVATIDRRDGHPQDVLTTNQQAFGDSDENKLRFVRANEALGTAFGIARNSGSNLAASMGEMAQFVESRDQGLARLEELYSRFTRALIEDRKHAEDDLAARRRKQDEDASALRSQIEDERKSMLAGLAKEREAFEARAKELDDRANTIARREIRKTLKEEFKKRQTEFGVTKDTQKKREPIVLAVSVLALLFGAGFVFYAYEFIAHPPSGNTLYVAMIRQVLLGAGFGGAVWYFIHWQNAWFQRHAEEEFKLKRLELDFDRASWVVELAMEWSKEKGGQEVPETVLRELTRNLFTEADSTTASKKQDVFSALLDASTKAELVVGTSKFSLNHKGGKKLKDALADEQ